MFFDFFQSVPTHFISRFITHLTVPTKRVINYVNRYITRGIKKITLQKLMMIFIVFWKLVTKVKNKNKGLNNNLLYYMQTIKAWEEKEKLTINII